MEPASPSPPPLAFQALVSSAESGLLLDELNLRVTELVKVMEREQRKSGGKPKASLALSFAFQLDQNGVMEVTASVTTKEPKTERSRSIFYALKNGMLSPNNPKQLTMDLGTPRELPAAEMRVI